MEGDPFAEAVCVEHTVSGEDPPVGVDEDGEWERRRLEGVGEATERVEVQLVGDADGLGELEQPVDLVDRIHPDEPDPVAELRRVFDMFWNERRPYMATLPNRGNPSGIYDPDEREAFIASWKTPDGGGLL